MIFNKIAEIYKLGLCSFLDVSSDVNVFYRSRFEMRKPASRNL